MAAHQHFVNDFDRKICYFLDLRFFVVCLIGFTGFFRIQELLDVQLQHIAWLPDHIQIYLPHSKVDQHRDGDTVFIARTGTKYCPVAPIQTYILGNSGARYRKRQTRVSDTQITQDKEGAQGIQNEGYFLYQNERNFPREDTHPPYRKQEFRFA